jgi:hypothetical protein
MTVGYNAAESHPHVIATANWKALQAAMAEVAERTVAEREERHTNRVDDTEYHKRDEPQGGA